MGDHGDHWGPIEKRLVPLVNYMILLLFFKFWGVGTIEVYSYYTM